MERGKRFIAHCIKVCQSVGVLLTLAEFRMLPNESGAAHRRFDSESLAQANTRWGEQRGGGA